MAVVGKSQKIVVLDFQKLIDNVGKAQPLPTKLKNVFNVTIIVCNVNIRRKIPTNNLP